MSLTLAGENVLLDSSGIEELVNSRLRSYVWPALVQYDRELECSPFVPDDHSDTRFTLPYGEPPAPRLNEFIDPTGIARYGRGMFLVGKQAMAKIALDAFGYAGDLSSSPASWGTTANGIPLSCNYGSQTFTRTVLPFPPLAVESINRTELWLVPVVDVRHTWIQLSVKIDFEKGRSWSDLIDLLIAPLQVSPTVPGIDARFAVPDPRTFADRHVSPAVALDAVMLSLGYRGMLDASSNLVFQDATTSLANLATELGDPEIQIGGASPEMPASDSVTVSGPRAVNYVDCESWEDTATVPGGNSGIEPVAVWTSFYEHELNGSVPSSNSQDRGFVLEALGEVFDDWRTKHAIISCPGVKSSFRTSASFDYISYYVCKAESIYTSAITFPPDFFPRVNYCQWEDNFLHLPAGSDWIFWTTQEIPKAEETSPGSGEYTPGEATARIYEFDDAGNLSRALTDSGSNAEDIPLYNHNSDRKISKEIFQMAGTISKKPVATVPDGDHSARIRFRAVARIANRCVYVEVLKIEGQAIDPDTGDPLELGGQVQVYDPNNLWPEIERDAIGWAYFQKEIEDDPSTPEEDESQAARWEIEDCALPVNRLTGELRDCLTKCQATAQVILFNPKFSAIGNFSSASNCANVGGPRAHTKRSSYNATHLPPEIQFNGQPFTQITAFNREDLDGIRGSEVTIERTTNADFADPFNQTVPQPGSATWSEWRIVAVKKRKARWIWGTWNPSQPQIEGFCDGDDPRLCGPVEVIARESLPCPLEDEFFQAAYDPEEDKYFLVNTVSAWMGTPETLYHVDGGQSESDSDGMAFDGCTLDYRVTPHKGWTCGLDPIDKSTDIELIPKTVIDGVHVSGDSWYFSTQIIYICAAQDGADIQIEGTDCDDYYYGS